MKIKRYLIMCIVGFSLPLVGFAQTMNNCSSFTGKTKKQCQQTATQFNRLITKQQQQYQQSFQPIITEGDQLIASLGSGAGERGFTSAEEQAEIGAGPRLQRVPGPARRPRLSPQDVTEKPIPTKPKKSDRPILPKYY